MYNIILCDDDEYYLSYLENLFTETASQEITFQTYSSVEEFISRLNSIVDCDLLVTDIYFEKDKLNGYDAAKEFRKHFPYSVLVISSCIDSCPLPLALELSAYRFFDKTLTDEELKPTLIEIFNKIDEEKKEPVICGKFGLFTHTIKYNEIYYIENYRYGSYIYTTNDAKFITKSDLDELYTILKNYSFEYAHSSYIVNLNYVHTIKSGHHSYLILKNGKELNISRSRYTRFFERFSKHIMNNN